MPMTIQHVEEEKQKKEYNKKIAFERMEKLEKELKELKAELLLPLFKRAEILAKKKEGKVKKPWVEELENFKKLINVETLKTSLDKENHPYILANVQRHIKSKLPIKKPKYEGTIDKTVLCQIGGVNVKKSKEEFDNMAYHHYHSNRLYGEGKRPEGSVTASADQDEERKIKHSKNTSNLNSDSSFFGYKSKVVNFEAALQEQRKQLIPSLSEATKSILFNNPSPVSSTDELQTTPIFAIPRK